MTNDSASLPTEFIQRKTLGNEAFKQENYSAAIDSYSSALSLLRGTQNETCTEMGMVYSNRALCHIKLGKYEECVKDATCSLRINPSNVKALYRRAQALQQLHRLNQALDDVRRLLQLEPNNPAALALGESLSNQAENLSKEANTVHGKLRKIFSVLSDLTGEEEERVSSSKDLAILSRESPAAQQLICESRLCDMIQLMPSLSSSCQQHLLQTLAGVCQGSVAGSHAVLTETSFSLIASFLSKEDSSLRQAATSILYHSLSSLLRTQEGSVPPPQLQLAEGVTKQVLDWVDECNRGGMGTGARDVLLESLMPTVSCQEMGYCLMKNELVKKLLSSSATRCTDKSKGCVITLIHNFYQTLGNDKARRKSVQDACFCFVMYRMRDEENFATCLEGVSVLSVITQASPELGNGLLGNEKIFSVTLRLAGCEEETAQLMAAESIALAASDKDRYHALIEAIPILKSLYRSENVDIRVRALVGICKLTTLSKHNESLELSQQSLEAACREFLDQSQPSGVKRWAIEGLAFLSISAPVKQSICQDDQLLHSITDLAGSSEDSAIQYGAATLFVNLSNSYDKPERNPELEELARFSGEHVPTPHPLDAEEYLTERISLLLNHSIIPILNHLSKCTSLSTCEQTTRVFLALVEQQQNRGRAVQQGAGKSLILLTKHNTDTGFNIAAQAIAKISITTNPELAFPGERVLETITPLVRLLKSQSQLQQFEALLALTNLSSLGTKLCRKIVNEKGVHWIESLQFEEHEMLRRAATECMCNLVMCEEVKELYRQEGNDRVKLLTLFSGEDDVLLQKAASGALCILSEDSKICTRILDVKKYFEITEQLLVSEEELQFRAIYILSNLVLANRSTAERVLKYERGLELFELCTNDHFSERIRGIARAALEQLISYGLVKKQSQNHLVLNRHS